MRLILATHNPHKTREFAAILGPGFEISDLSMTPDIPTVEENGNTFAENAIAKAVTVSRVLDGLVIADDSGLEVTALGGAPGVRSARFAGDGATDQENVARLLAELAAKELESVDRAARFCCVLALAQSGKLISHFDGEVPGAIVTPPRGAHGFGYDPIFVPIGFARTFAELSDEIKNCISHRARATAQLREYLITTR